MDPHGIMPIMPALGLGVLAGCPRAQNGAREDHRRLVLRINAEPLNARDANLVPDSHAEVQRIIVNHGETGRQRTRRRPRPVARRIVVPTVARIDR